AGCADSRGADSMTLDVSRWAILSGSAEAVTSSSVPGVWHAIIRRENETVTQVITSAVAARDDKREARMEGLLVGCVR
ncbi:MAG: hypothetical protein WBD40_24220, partial [Tepidisphaeraceae bacterium]